MTGEPAVSRAVAGRIVDLDSHVMPDAATAADWGGPLLGRWTAEFTDEVDRALQDRARAEALDDVWAVRGWLALGALDVADRLAALDLMGVGRQLVFPPVTLPALLDDATDPVRSLERWNDAVTEWAGGGSGRLFEGCRNFTCIGVASYGLLAEDEVVVDDNLEAPLPGREQR